MLLYVTGCQPDRHYVIHTSVIFVKQRSVLIRYVVVCDMACGVMRCCVVWCYIPANDLYRLRMLHRRRLRSLRPPLRC